MFDDAIEEFWEWWAEVREGLASAIEAEAESDLIEALTDHVWRIHPELDWQLAPGVTATHSLNLVSGGSRLMRLVAELWRRTGPGDDALWEYHPARLPFPPEAFIVRGEEVDPDDARVEIAPDQTFRRLDMVVSHPVFGSVGEDEARDVALYLLDAALGEDEAERWVGLLTTEAAGGSIALVDLATTVERLVDGWEGHGWEDVSDQYDGVVEAQVDRSIKWIDHIDKPIYAEVTLQSLTNDDEGMPVELERQRLDSITRDLTDGLGDRAVLMGAATGDGERSLHLYVANSPSVGEAIAAWKDANPNREIDDELQADEQWAYAEQWD